MGLCAYRVKVTGRVQRAGYRRFMLDVAQDLGVSGYVENMRDGSVVVFVQGPEPKVSEFLERVRAPPTPVVVKEFQVEDVEPKPEIECFEVKFGSLVEEFYEGFAELVAALRGPGEEFVQGSEGEL